MSFTHLHSHTQYSLLDGSNRIKDYCAKVKELGMTSCAITDHGSMFGVIDFYKECKKQGIKPILGCEVYVAPGSRFDKEAVVGENKYNHLILLAENDEGYHNLIKLVSRGYTQGYYYRPRVDKELLREYHSGLIASSACLAGEIPRKILARDFNGARETAIEYNEIFGQNNFFLELQDHGIDKQKIVNQELYKLSKELSIPLIATNDIHYTNAEDAKAHDVLICVQTNASVASTDRMRYEGESYYVKSEEEMKALFPYAPDAIENTQKIADRCNVEIVFGEKKLPKYNVPSDYSNSFEYLKYLCNKGLKERYSDITEEISGRLEMELNTIKSMGFVDYFLIVWDFINYAKNQKIPVGPGRGSAAGSIVAYTLGITGIDPFKYNLIFERFLNPERVSMPDIDIDFCYERRQEVIDYVIDLYGKDNVSQIITFGSLQARGVVRDVARVLDLPYEVGDKIAKKIPQELNITLDLALQKNPELMELYNDDETVKKVIDISKQLEGLPRHISRHAAGVLISNRPVEDYVPLALTRDDAIVEQFDMVTLEELGLLKMDFLGLRTLTVIKDTIDNIKNTKGIEVDIDKIDLEDPDIYKMISAGDTDGVFQLESAGMRNFMKELKPESIDDIIAGIALFRPGPMDFIPKYIKGKENKASIAYDTKELEHILKDTYGCIVYQEQVMQIVRDLAGFPMGRSDELRRAMSKKKQNVMLSERQVFVYGDESSGIPGCIENGISESIANKIYDDMTDFAKYAFNKSHAAAYAIIALQTAYLKCHYPVEFMAALLTSVVDNSSKLENYIYICKEKGIKILPPNINKGSDTFQIDYYEEDGKEKAGISYSLSAIKSIGDVLVKEIISKRNKSGEFKSIDDFVIRCKGVVNKKAFEMLIKAGALDCLHNNRRSLLYGMDDLLKLAKSDSNPNQLGLFDLAPQSEYNKMTTTLPNVEEYDKETLLNFEKEATGIYISGHPLEDYIDLWRKTISHSVAQIKENEEITDGLEVTLVGQVLDYRPYVTKSGRNMAFFTLEDLTGTIEVLLFPQKYHLYSSKLADDVKIILKGRISKEEEKDTKVIVDSISDFDQKQERLVIKFANKKEFFDNQEMLNSAIVKGGNGEVVIIVEAERQQKVIRNVEINNALIDLCKNIVGEENVKYTS